MQFPFGQTVYRDRARPITDPYDPEHVIAADWSDPDTITVLGAFVAAASSADSPTATRSQVITAKSLYCSNPLVDVQVGDRVRVGESTFAVRVKPEADINPFTGWQPVKEIPLEEVAG
jgi:hypothetical protein